MSAATENSGCVNRGFEANDDGFHTIDLRSSKNEEHESAATEEVSAIILLLHVKI